MFLTVGDEGAGLVSFLGLERRSNTFALGLFPDLSEFMEEFKLFRVVFFLSEFSLELILFFWEFSRDPSPFLAAVLCATILGCLVGTNTQFWRGIFRAFGFTISALSFASKSAFF